MKKVDYSDFYDLFSMYDEKELLAFYELFTYTKNKALKGVVKELFKQLTDEDLTEEVYEQAKDDFSLTDIVNKNPVLSDDQFRTLDGIVFSSHYFLFESMEFDLESEYPDDADYIELSFHEINVIMGYDSARREAGIPLRLTRRHD